MALFTHSKYERAYKRDKLYDISSKGLIPWEVEGKKYNIYDNVNLSMGLRLNSWV